MKDERLFLEDMLARITMIEDFTVEGRDTFMASPLIQEAVIRCFEVLGEITKRLSADKLAAYPEIPWKQLTGFRDFLIHKYDQVKLDIVWKAVRDDIPHLRTAVEAMIQALDNSEE